MPPSTSPPTLIQLTIWLQHHRRYLGTRDGRRAASCRAQALMVLRWFRDDTTVRMLAIDAHLGISTAYRYLHEGIAVLAAQAPDLHKVLERARTEGWPGLIAVGLGLHDQRIHSAVAIPHSAEISRSSASSGRTRCQGSLLLLPRDD